MMWGVLAWQTIWPGDTGSLAMLSGIATTLMLKERTAFSRYWNSGRHSQGESGITAGLAVRRSAVPDSILTPIDV